MYDFLAMLLTGGFITALFLLWFLIGGILANRYERQQMINKREGGKVY